MEKIFLELVCCPTEELVWDHNSVVLDFEEMVEKGLVGVAGHQRCNDVDFAIEDDQARLCLAAFEIVLFFDALFVALKNGLIYPIPTRDFSPFPTMFLNLPQSLLSFSRVSVQRLLSSTG